MMENQESIEKTNAEQVYIDKLIQFEWRIINILQKKLEDPDLTTVEWTKASNSLALHMNSLSRMLNKKGETSQYTEESLGEFVRNVQPKTRRINRVFRIWTRRLSARRS